MRRFDRWNATQLSMWLISDGLDGIVASLLAMEPDHDRSSAYHSGEFTFA
jgi:hypothetical protein